MAIDSKNLGPLQAYQKLTDLQTQKPGQANAQTGDNRGIDNASQKVEQNVTKAEMRVQQQASLVSHLFGDGEQTQQTSLKMTYQSAIEKLNEILMADFSAAGVEFDAEGDIKPISQEKLEEQGGMEYWTPENTAKRIIAGATAFLPGFQSAHPELEGEALMEEFMNVVGGGLASGFEEAKGILSDLDVLEGSIADNIDKTILLVDEGMTAFKEEFLASIASALSAKEQTAE